MILFNKKSTCMLDMACNIVIPIFANLDPTYLEAYPSRILSRVKTFIVHKHVHLAHLD